MIPGLAILFWFYKDLSLCQNRLQWLRQKNPRCPIYGLYGGDGNDREQFAQGLSSYLEDFYSFDQPQTSHWKWLNGDLMINQWYRDRGQFLPWETVVVIQWDMVILAPLSQVFPQLKPGHLLLSFYRPIAEIAHHWEWVKKQPHRDRYQEFLSILQQRYGYAHSPMCAIFIVVALPRIFLEAYSQVADPELGFIEYRVPIYSQIFGIGVDAYHPPRVNVPAKLQRVLTAANPPVRLGTILCHWLLPGGARVFHPYNGLIPLGWRQWLSQGLGLIYRLGQEILGQFKDSSKAPHPRA